MTLTNLRNLICNLSKTRQAKATRARRREASKKQRKAKKAA